MKYEWSGLNERLCFEKLSLIIPFFTTIERFKRNTVEVKNGGGHLCNNSFSSVLM